MAMQKLINAQNETIRKQQQAIIAMTKNQQLKLDFSPN